MADTKISDLPALDSLSSTDLVPVVDASSSTAKKSTISQFDGRYQASDSDLAAISGSGVGSVLAATTASYTSAEESKLAGIETNATSDQTDSEIETAYNNQVAEVSKTDAENGASTTVYRWTPERVAQAIAALETDSVDSVNSLTGTVLLNASDVGAQSNISGGGSLINSLSNVTGTTNLDLGLGNVQNILSTTGNYTLTVSGFLSGKFTSFLLIINTSNDGDTPTWPNNTTWPSGEPNIVWTASTVQFINFMSLDGGTNFLAWHLSPGARFDSEIFTISDDATVGANLKRVYNDSGEVRTIKAVRLSSGGAVGSDLIVDVNKDGSTIFTTQSNRPKVTSGNNTVKETSIDVASWADGSYISIDLDSDAGSDRTVAVIYQQGA